MLQMFKRLLGKKVIFEGAREYQVGQYSIILPAHHSLDVYQRTYSRYDVALGEISKIVFEKYQNGTAIDIGANVGDSAVLISKYKKIPILCIEGNPKFIPFLIENIRRLDNKRIIIEQSFVGVDNQFVDGKKIKSNQGTATIVGAVGLYDQKTSDNKFSIPMKNLETILHKYPQFLETKLLKIDTDGYDFGIIKSSLKFIETSKPILFFEYYLDVLDDGDFESISTISELVKLHYQYFVVYDNFGNYMLSTSDLEQFKDLNTYLKSNKKHKQIIYYFDICAFHQDDEDLFNDLRQKERLINDKT